MSAQEVLFFLSSVAVAIAAVVRVVTVVVVVVAARVVAWFLEHFSP